MTNLNDIERLFKTHYTQMHRIATVLLHDDDSARDIVNDVFTSLLNKPIGSEINGNYLLRAVRNRCLNEIRNKDIRDRIYHGYFLSMEEYDEAKWPDEATMAAIESIVKSCLPRQSYNVIRLRFYDGLSFADIAKSLGISQTAVFKHMRHALILIRKSLTAHG